MKYWLEPAKMKGDSESGWDFIEGDEDTEYLLDMKVRLP